MCRDCVKVEYPRRQRTCLDTGAYVLNFKGCSVCGKLDFLSTVGRVGFGWQRRKTTALWKELTRV